MQVAAKPSHLYTSGDFTDLCRGGHCDSPAHDIPADSFVLEKIAGAYWRGDETKPMLTHASTVSHSQQKQTSTRTPPCSKRQRSATHKKLGLELGIYTISPLIGAGLPLLKPNGAIIRRELEEYLWELHKEKGYSRVWTPHMTRPALYETSGHASKFGDELFRVKGKDEEFILKPMNCPHHMQIFADDQFSYRDMPVRYFEPATVYRDEKTGQLAGLTRVRRDHPRRRTPLLPHKHKLPMRFRPSSASSASSTQPWDSSKVTGVRLSVRGEGGMYIGEDAVWEKAEAALETAAQTNELNYRRVEGEAAFYGPKLDFMFKDAIGREWQTCYYPVRLQPP